jgi:Proteasome-substrate-size regulator, mid region
MSILIEKTKGERGYTSTGRLITRVLNTLCGIYPTQGRFANPAVWDDPGMLGFVSFAVSTLICVDKRLRDPTTYHGAT